MSFFKRFYFDDGDSRKRWQVRVTGRAQIVAHGRLSGTLRESKKTFKSPKEALAAAEKLIATKKRAGYIEINPASLEIEKYKGKKVATESQIASLEKRIGCRLPDEYREFLATRNGGRPNPAYVQIPGIEDIENVGVADIFGLFGTAETANSLAWAIENLVPMIPEGHLPIAGDSDLFTLSLRKKDFGCVHFWFHETDQVDDEGHYLEGASHLLAGSFDEFLTRIVMVFGVPEETDSADPSTQKANGKKPARKATVRTLFKLLNLRHTPAVVEQIVDVVKELGDLSGIQDGEWPFNNFDSEPLVRSLLNAGLKPEIVDTHNQTLLWQCAGSPDCIDLLLKHNVDLERISCCDREETALMRALFIQSVPGVKRLLEVGADPTVSLPSYIHSNIKYRPDLSQLLADAIEKWKK
jgi:predicted DNA-binding WGR domain protein